MTVADPLNLPGVVTIKHVTYADQHVFEAKGIDPDGPACCLLFQFERAKNGTKSVSLLDTSREGLPVVIHYKRQRWKCNGCGKRVVYETMPFAANRHDMTNRLADWVFRQAQFRSFSQIAAEIGVTDKTVASVFMRRAVPAIRDLRVETPRVLGLDEKHMFNGFRAVMGNIETKSIFWMLKARNEPTLRAFFKKMKNRERVEVITIDMYRPYVNLLHEFFPTATIVIDKFHILRYATQGIERARGVIRKNLSKPDRIRLMHERFTLLKRRHTWTDRDRKRFEGWRTKYPDLVNVYDLKEAVHEIFDDPTISKDEAIRRYLDWLDHLPV